MELLLDDKSVIHKPEPKPRGWRQNRGLPSQNTPLYRLATMGLTGRPDSSPTLPPHRIYFEKRSMYYADKTLQVQ